MADLRIAAATTTPITPPTAPSSISATRGGGEGFSESLSQAVASVNDMQLQARDAATAVASGKGVDSAQALVTIEKANISFQFAMQIRNKLLEAYQEVMRMQV
jgi:flagellar hook-basal body complex protein FliE